MEVQHIFPKNNQNAHDWAAFEIATAQSTHQSIKALLATVVP